MNITLVTDNRFWRFELGSHKRITALVNYLSSSGHELSVIFLGKLFDPDRPGVASLPSTYRFEAPFGFASADEQPSPGGVRGPTSIARFKRFAKLALIETRRVLTDPAHIATTMSTPWPLALREPKLRDFVRADHRAAFEQFCARTKPEIVIVEYIRLGYLLDGLRARVRDRVKFIVDTHDVMHERRARFHSRGEVHDIDITAAEEGRVLRRFDALMAIQNDDAAKLRSLAPGVTVIVVGHPMALHPGYYRSSVPVNIGFFGSNMAPNVDAVRLLLRDIVPRIASTFGDKAQFHIFGRVCEAFAAADVPGTVHLRGFVSDLIPAYEAIDIVVAPIDYGGGLSIKNVEALCFGKPLITTRIGAEGLEDGIGRAFIAITSAQEMIDALARLIASPQEREALGSAALDYARSHFDERATFGALMSYIDPAWKDRPESESRLP